MPANRRCRLEMKCGSQLKSINCAARKQDVTVSEGAEEIRSLCRQYDFCMDAESCAAMRSLSSRR